MTKALRGIVETERDALTLNELGPTIAVPKKVALRLRSTSQNVSTSRQIGDEFFCPGSGLPATEVASSLRGLFIPRRYGAVLQLPALTQVYTRLHVTRLPSIEHAHESLNVLHHACWVFAMSRYASDDVVTRVPGDAQPASNAAMSMPINVLWVFIGRPLRFGFRSSVVAARQRMRERPTSETLTRDDRAVSAKHRARRLQQSYKVRRD